MAKVYQMTAGDYEIFKRAADPSNGVGANWFLSYYFGGREFRQWQWHLHHAYQKQLTVVGGTGSGKTVGAGLSYAIWAAMTPGFRFMNLAPTGWQSKLMFEAILREMYNRPFERFVFKTIERPYPVIFLRSDYIGESRMEFMSAGDNAERIQGVEVDAINGDEFGIILDATWLMTMMVTRTRGDAPLPNGGYRPRLKRMSIITANYDVTPPWLWTRMDRMLTDSKNFLSMQVKSSDNLSEEDIEDLKLIIPEDQHEQMLEGKQPEGVGIHFSAESVAACESRETLQWAQYHLLEKEVPTPGWRVEERATIGCVHFEMPPEADRLYLLVGDPGQDNPPHRNSPVIAVWDITDFPDKPAELRCFQWVFGNGSYDPFKIAYKYCYETYRPIEAIVDDTGSQKLWTEQVFFNLGIWTIGSNFAGMKEGMLVATQQQVQRRLYKWPFILGFRSQLVRYDITQDNKNSKLPQDIVAMLMMTSWHLRKYLWEDVAEKSTPAHPVELRSAKFQRETPLTARG